MDQLANTENSKRTLLSVIGSPVDALTWETALGQIKHWAERRKSCMVCICNTHSLVCANEDPSFGSIIREADMVTPDGAPVAWMMSILGKRRQLRINGPDLMWMLCESLNNRGAPSIYLYGNTADTNAKLYERLQAAFPDLNIAGTYSPRFGNLSGQELQEHAKAITDSGAAIVFVSLGCPKQERWMADQKLNGLCAVSIGVGAAFDYHAGTIKRAPAWMQRSGLEWFHRLCSEPRRLWRRYLYSNTSFLFQAMLQLLWLGKRSTTHSEKPGRSY